MIEFEAGLTKLVAYATVESQLQSILQKTEKEKRRIESQKLATETDAELSEAEAKAEHSDAEAKSGTVRR